MDSQKKAITYFTEPGPQNTDETFAEALVRAQDLQIDQLVVASDSGKTGQKAAEFFRPGFHVLIVTNPPGMTIPVKALLDQYPHARAHKARLVADGIHQIPASVPAATAAAIRQQGASVAPIDWKQVAEYHRSRYQSMERLGVGVRVAFNIAVFGVLSKKLNVERSLLAIAGTGFAGGGADTAIIVRPGSRFEDWWVDEIICMPRR